MKELFNKLYPLVGVILLTLVAGIWIGVRFTPEPEQPEIQQREALEAKKEVPPPNAEELLTLVNKARAEAGVAPLKLDPRLNASAERKASDMVIYGYFGHENYDGTMGTDYIPVRSIGCDRHSENITQNVYENSSRNAMKNFRNSEPHWNAILEPDYDLIGFGIEENHVVQHFCDL